MADHPAKRSILGAWAVTAIAAVAVAAVAIGAGPWWPDAAAQPVPQPAAQPAASSPRVANIPAVGGAPRTVGWVGDSIGWQSRHAIEAQVSRTRRLSSFNSIIGATVEAQRPAAEEAVTAPGGPDILLVELGHNDASRAGAAQFAADVRRFLDGVTPHVECVRWFDLKRGGSPYYEEFNHAAVTFNAVLADVIDEYPTVRTVSYASWADILGPTAFDIDGVHLSERGELELGVLADRAADLCQTEIEAGLLT